VPRGSTGRRGRERRGRRERQTWVDWRWEVERTLVEREGRLGVLVSAHLLGGTCQRVESPQQAWKVRVQTTWLATVQLPILERLR
jgi:hypothetical protein